MRLLYCVWVKFNIITIWLSFHHRTLLCSRKLWFPLTQTLYDHRFRLHRDLCLRRSKTATLKYKPYINYIHTVSNKFDYILYADDTTLVSNTSTFKSHNNQLTISENINFELLKISDWIAVNKLSLNAKKASIICCSISHTKQTGV